MMTGRAGRPCDEFQGISSRCEDCGGRGTTTDWNMKRGPCWTCNGTGNPACRRCGWLDTAHGRVKEERPPRACDEFRGTECEPACKRCGWMEFQHPPLRPSATSTSLASNVREGERRSAVRPSQFVSSSRARILKPPAPLDLGDAISVALFGSIEMGGAPDWQSRAEAALADLPVLILNPRRDGWDSTWEQRMSDPRFRGQVEWELEAAERATFAAMHFDPATKSPVTMEEFGLLARSGRLMVSCPEGFWRKGNIEIGCARYGVPLFDSLEALMAAVRARLVALLAEVRR